MKIRINDRPDIQEIEVIINCVADDPLVNKIISALNTVDAKLLCRRQGETFQLGLADILYIESVDSPARAASSLCGLKWNTALVASGHRGQRWGKVEGRRFSAPPFSVSPQDNGKLKNISTHHFI